MKIIRVFTRRTNATPIDEEAYVGFPDMFVEAEEIHISVAFTYDIVCAERLAVQWEKIAPVKIGGPALDDPGGNFISGRYLKPGYTITSRGCPNNCWFCSVPKREGAIRELPIVDGWNVLDSNLLACSESHIRSVFKMLNRQKHRAEFTGGLEAAKLLDWHVDLLSFLEPRPSIFFAYDTSDDLEPLIVAGQKLFAAGFTKVAHNLRCYVLIGYPGDELAEAENRLRQTWAAGFLPMAMLWRNKNGDRMPEWRTFQRQWARPASVVAQIK